MNGSEADGVRVQIIFGKADTADFLAEKRKEFFDAAPLKHGGFLKEILPLLKHLRTGVVVEPEQMKADDSFEQGIFPFAEGIGHSPAVSALDDGGLHLMDSAPEFRVGSFLETPQNAFQTGIVMLNKFRHGETCRLFVVVIQEFEEMFEVVVHRLTAFPGNTLSVRRRRFS